MACGSSWASSKEEAPSFASETTPPYVELLTNEQFMSALRGEDGDAEPAKG
jgi:hypothetical protein